MNRFSLVNSINLRKISKRLNFFKKSKSSKYDFPHQLSMKRSGKSVFTPTNTSFLIFHCFVSLFVCYKYLDLSLISNSRNRRETIDIFDENEDNKKIFCVLIPIYYRFLYIFLLYNIARFLYSSLLSFDIGSDFGNNGELSNIQILNVIFFACFVAVDSGIWHIVTFWFLQPSSGDKALKRSYLPASILGYECTLHYILF